MRRKIKELSIVFVSFLIFASIVACGNNNEKMNKEVNEKTLEGVQEVVLEGGDSIDEYLLANEEWPSIAEKYQSYFPIGAAIEADSLENEMELAVLTKNFNSITCENMMKPTFTQPTEGNFTFEKAESIVDFALENDMRIVGHNLVWYMQTEPWMFQDSNGKALDPSNSKDCALVEQRMKDHITTVIRHYEDAGHIIERWDVVNEAILQTESDGYRKCDWYQFLGKDYVTKAFQFAYEADMQDGTKDIRLFYNDYEYG